MAQYIALFYAKYFLEAPVATAAARNDLELWKNMTIYSKYGSEIAQAVKESTIRQQW